MAEPEEKTEKSTLSEITVDGYTFIADTDLMDDVEAFEYIDSIENKGRVAAIVPLLTFLIGRDEYLKLKAYYTEKDGIDHAAKLKANGKPVDEAYKPRMRMNKLHEVYLAIIEKYNPKG